MDDGFLGDKEDEFLGYLLDKYEVNFLDWAHKTKWLKQEMKRRSCRTPSAAVYTSPEPRQYSLIDWATKRKNAAINVPIELLKQTSADRQRTRA